MKAFVIRLGNNLPRSDAKFLEEEYILLAEDIVGALVKADEVVTKMRGALARGGTFAQELRLTGVEEKYPMLDSEAIQELISAAKETLEG